MAKRAGVRRKKKTARVGSAANALMNRKYYGEERPIPQGREITQAELADRLTWYGQMCDAGDAREWLVDYLVGHNKSLLAKQVKKVPDNSFPLTASWLARIAMGGGILSAHSKAFLLQCVENSLRYVKEDEPEKEAFKPKKPNIQDRLNEKSSDMIGEIEGMIDDGYTEGLYDLLRQINYPAMLAKRIADHFRPQLAEVTEAMAGKDDQLKEGYRHFTKKKLADHAKMLGGFISDAERHASNAKNVAKGMRKPRAKKAVPAEKKVKGFKFQRESADFKVASVPSTKLIGVQELWLFNTKNRVLTQVRALDRGGLDVKGNKIIGFDEKTSVSKKLRENKVGDALEAVLRGGKRARDKLMESLTTKPTGLQYRGSDTTILLSVWI